MTSNREYFLVFDTNILFQRYEKEADFTSFSFGKKFEEIIDLVNQLDIYENITLVIPEVSWRELTKQIEDAYKAKVDDIVNTFEKFKFPGMRLDVYKSINYPEYIKGRIVEYKKELQKGINDVIDLPIPLNTGFSDIISRAFEKIPPFEGKEKQSDKGVKDALIWESILKFASDHSEANYILYCNDKGFKESLNKEFLDRYPNATLSICQKKDEVKNELEQWAKTIVDKYSYKPVKQEMENVDFIEWLESGDFTIQIIDVDFGLTNRGKEISGKFVNLVGYDNVSEEQVDEEITVYTVDVVLSTGYLLDDGETIEKKINAVVTISCSEGNVYTVDDLEFETEG